MKMKIMLEPTAFMPVRAHETDAGLDLYATEERDIPCIGTKLLHDGGVIEELPPCAVFDTGVHISLEQGTYARVDCRSGLNFNNNVVLGGAGIIDNGFRGTIKVKLYNFGTSPYTVHRGDRIAQLIVSKYETPEIDEVDSMDDTDRGNNGFGSSGV